MIEKIDAMVGTLVATLEEEGIARNTLFIFTSDNGLWIKFQNTASHPLYGEALLLVGSALPFRDGKGSTWEGGVRVPGVWYWPGTIPAGSRVTTPASTFDIAGGHPYEVTALQALITGFNNSLAAEGTFWD